ncbi:superoxide dismutase [Stenotrophomonas sp. S41]|uniref:superoxide dismutase n=1 Tax=Stenotrophomonas sp. S41 TaxID=2767464 RepID=UPI00190B6957|nr:superoxide dismutase [Stenotrophomonas sp. S41]MBK0010797.1 superoxide dismutase [Stenotrophomonas sp. S41]
MKALHLLCLAVAAWTAPVHAESERALTEENAPFSLPALPYPATALAPAIDQQTMDIHHGRHHKAYVDNLNKAVSASPQLQALSLRELLAVSDKAGPSLRNNAGGHYNHSLFWSLLAPPGQGGAPSEALLTAINKDFGSLPKFKEAFSKAATGVFGSGWAWLILDGEGALKVVTTPNQDNPLMPFTDTPGVPLLALDVWEHAYYLEYQNKRPAYIDAWWSVVNWNEVNERFKRARQ